MDGRRTGGESDDFFVFTHKGFQIRLKGVDIRPKRDDPIGVESFLDIFLFESRFAHMGEAEVDAFIVH